MPPGTHQQCLAIKTASAGLVVCDELGLKRTLLCHEQSKWVRPDVAFLRLRPKPVVSIARLHGPRLILAVIQVVRQLDLQYPYNQKPLRAV